jgi:hypothetical protein
MLANILRIGGNPWLAGSTALDHGIASPEHLTSK